MKKLCASLLLMVCLSAHASELALFTEAFPPYNFSEKNDVVGINSDILSRACTLAEVKCTFSLLPWHRAFKEAQSTINSGVFSTSRTAQREQGFIWVGPLVSSNSCFYRLKERTDITVVNEQSLKNYTVGITRGDIYESVLQGIGLQKGKNYLTYSKKQGESNMFKQGKLDLLIGLSLTLESQLFAVGLKPEDVVPVFELNDDSLVGNYLALNKQSAPLVAAKLQNALDNLKQSGEVESIISRYTGVPIMSKGSLPTPLERCVNGKANY
ncbi:substrate-binding periplasmic protein [Pseudoalteromonas sp. GB56]